MPDLAGIVVCASFLGGCDGPPTWFWVAALVVGIRVGDKLAWGAIR